MAYLATELNCLMVLKRLVRGGWTDVHMWAPLANGQLARTLVQLIGNAGDRLNPVSTLDCLWQLLNDSRAAEQIKLYYIADEPIDVERIHRNGCALVAIAQAAVALRQSDSSRRNTLAQVLTWWQRAGEVLVKKQLPAPGQIDCTRLQLSYAGVLGAAVEVAAKLGWPVVSLQCWTDRLLGIQPATSNVGIRIPVLGVTPANEGVLGDLYLVRVEGGDEDLFEDPEIALRPVRSDLLQSIAEQHRRYVLTSSVSWSVKIRPMVNQPWKHSPWMALDGRSLGAAAAVGFHLLESNGSYDGGCAITAAMGKKADDPLKDELAAVQGLEARLRVVAAWNRENPGAPIQRLGVAAWTTKAARIPGIDSLKVELLGAVGEAVEFCQQRVIASNPERSESSRQAPNWLQSVVRSSVFTVYAGIVLWFLLGWVRLAIAPVQMLDVVEVSWLACLACPFVAALLYLPFPTLRLRLTAVTRIGFYIMIMLGLFLAAVAAVATLLARQNQRILLLPFSFALNGLLLFLALRRMRVSDRFSSTVQPVKPPNGHHATSIRLNSLAVLWVLLATIALLAPLFAIAATIITRPHQPWRLLLLWSTWLIVNIDALHRSHRRYASARIGIVVMMLFTFYALALFWDFNLFRNPDPRNLWLGVVLLVALLPLRFRREAPGVRIAREDEPAIWKVIDEIAQATRQRTPDALYTIAEVNAYAGRAHGTNLLILGLPLMAILRVSELRAVIAHEFGHYRANDTAWAGRIYRCRHAIENVIKRFREVEEMVPARCHGMIFRAGVRVTSVPFLAYNVIFRRVLRSVIEAQEHSADQIAGVVAGRWAVRNAIRVVERASSAFDSYWQDVVLPIIKIGYRPHLSEGFVEYLRKGEGLGCAGMRRMAPSVGFAALEFHPSVQSRLSNLLDGPDVIVSPSDPPAITLIRDVEEHERQIFGYLGFNGLLEVSRQERT